MTSATTSCIPNSSKQHKRTMLRQASRDAFGPRSLLRLGKKSLWGYVAIAFNKVDADRLRLVGPDRLCAEWLLKNSGAVRLVEMPNKLVSDYNSLPPESSRFRVREVDATDSSVMKIGLDHFKGCQHIEKVILHQCKHLEDDGLEGLSHLKDTLKDLQISGCSNLVDTSFGPVGDLKRLKKLKLFELQYVKHLDKIKADLQKQLPQCQIEATVAVK